jgi:hypothetical protein
MMTQQTNQSQKNSPNQGSLYRETNTLRQLTTRQNPPAIEEGDDVMDNIGVYLKILGALSVISLLAGFLAAALTQ